MERKQRKWAIGITIAVIALSILGIAPQVSLRFLTAGASAPPPALTSPPEVERAGDDEPGLGDLMEIDQSAGLALPSSPSSIRAPGGIARLAIPEGAVQAATRIEMVRHAVRHEADPTGFAVDLKPDGLTFARAVRLEMPIPAGLTADDVEIVVYEPSEGSWVPEERQAPGSAAGTLVALIDHFSLRRLRIRPGLDYPGSSRRGRGTFFLTSSAGQTFERYVEGQWQTVRPASRHYRELMQLGRMGRHALILSGRLRAVSAARPHTEVLSDEELTVGVPAGSRAARTGWVRIRRLDAAGEPSGDEVIARVNDFAPASGARRAGVVVVMSRAVVEALGLTWGVDFGLDEADAETTWIRVRDDGDEPPLPYIPVQVEACEPEQAAALSPRAES
jgi:hypothetical protein